MIPGQDEHRPPGGDAGAAVATVSPPLIDPDQRRSRGLAEKTGA
jgi:hypothetical protein